MERVKVLSEHLKNEPANPSIINRLWFLVLVRWEEA